MAVDPVLSGLNQIELGLVERQCRTLGLGQPSSVDGVRTGRSGSLVVRLQSAGGRIVLKITDLVSRCAEPAARCAGAGRARPAGRRAD